MGIEGVKFNYDFNSFNGYEIFKFMKKSTDYSHFLKYPKFYQRYYECLVNYQKISKAYIEVSVKILEKDTITISLSTRILILELFLRILLQNPNLSRIPIFYCFLGLLCIFY